MELVRTVVKSTGAEEKSAAPARVVETTVKNFDEWEIWSWAFSTVKKDRLFCSSKAFQKEIDENFWQTATIIMWNSRKHSN